MFMVEVSMADGVDDAPEAVWLLEEFVNLFGHSAGALGHAPDARTPRHGQHQCCIHTRKTNA